MKTHAYAATYGHSRPSPLLFFREETSTDSESQQNSSPTAEREAEAATNWAAVHERLISLGRTRAAHERELCRWLLAAQRLAVHVRAGYASLREYAERVIGLNGRQTEERLRVGRALAALPLLDSALASGELPWSAVRELTRVATAQTEGGWLAWGKRRRVQQIEKAVAARRPGDSPHDPSDPSLVKHRLVFEVRAETMALFRDLQNAVRSDLGGDVDDDTLFYEMARRALRGETDDGRASYQVAVTRCDECGGTMIDAGGESHRVDDFVGEMAACDAQDVGGAGGTVPGANQSPQVGVSATPAVGTRSRQTIPPATRRHVMRRDHKRCVVPGCKNHRFLDVHHLDFLAEGGGHEPGRLAVLCGAHHRAVHAGALHVDGSATTGFVVRHADGTPYGAPVSPPALDVVKEVLGALQQLGFKPTHARSLLHKALAVMLPNDSSALLHAALRAS
jgi:hypothetical protein